jgi:TldD protein
MTTRRDFLKQTGIAAATAIAGSAMHRESSALCRSIRAASANSKSCRSKSCADALTAAKAAGASWPDARIGRDRQNFVGTRERQIVQVGDTDSIGIGVRALVDGAWGFAASQTLTKDGVAAAAREAGDRQSESHSRRAARRAGAVAVVSQRDVEERVRDRPVHDSRRAKAQVLIDANSEAMKVANVKFAAIKVHDFNFTSLSDAV